MELFLIGNHRAVTSSSRGTKQTTLNLLSEMFIVSCVYVCTSGNVTLALGSHRVPKVVLLGTFSKSYTFTWFYMHLLKVEPLKVLDKTLF